MFKKLVKRLLGKSPKSPSNMYFFEESRHGNTPITSNVSSTRSIPQVSAQTITEPTIEDLYQHQFYDFLFGKKSDVVAQQNDDLSLIVAQRIEGLINKPALILDSLPILPLSLGKLMELSNKSDFDTQQIVALIQQEPAIAAKVVELANSSFYSRGGKDVVDIRSAFMRLGVDGLSQGVINGFMSKLVPQADIYFQLYGKRIWQHSLSNGIYAKALIESTDDKEYAAQGYLIGLICRLGDVIIYQLLLEAFSVAHPDSCPNSVWFKQIMCKNSKKLTYHIAKHWGFPQAILDVLVIQANLNRASQCPAAYRKSPLALYVYEARIISELSMRFEHKDISEHELAQAQQALLHTPQAAALLSRVTDGDFPST